MDVYRSTHGIDVHAWSTLFRSGQQQRTHLYNQAHASLTLAPKLKEVEGSLRTLDKSTKL